MTTIASGTCGDDLTWRLEEDYYLFIEGTGSMKGYTMLNLPPWYSYSQDIIGVFIYNGATTIGMNAFYHCVNLKTVNLPDSLQTISSNAFENCSSLETIRIPSSVRTIGYDVFTECTSLSSINVDPGNEYYVSSGGILYDKQSTRLIKCPPKVPYLKEYMMPSTVSTIDARAFASCKTMTYVSISANITSIGSSAFSGCSSLKTIAFKGSNRPTIGSSAFALGSGISPTQCTVRSLNNALDGTLDAYKNSYTTFIYTDTNVTVSLTASPSDKGSVNGAGTYPIETYITISATPVDHYHLVSWSDGSADPIKSFYLLEDVTLTATFAIDTFTVTVSAEFGGTVTGEGTYDYGSTVIIAAVPDGDYKFIGWDDGAINNPRAITVTQNATYVAKFWTYDGELLLSYEKNGQTYMLECGTVTAVNDNINASVLVTPIVTCTANNAFAFDTGATENLTFNITRRNPPETDDVSTTVIDIPTVVDYRTLPTGPWEDTHRWCNRMWKIALESFIDRWQMKTDGCRVRFIPYVKNNSGGIYQREIDVNGYLKSLTVQYSTTSNEILTVQLSIAVGSMGKVN